jgi:ribosomal-protein-alanine N-acetyltransferase
MADFPTIDTARTVLTLLRPEHAEALLAYQTESRAHFAPWEPARLADYFTIEDCRARIDKSYAAFLDGTALNFIALDSRSGKIVAVCNFTNIVHGPFMACHLGYSIAAECEGQGLMHEVAAAGIDYMFKVVGLHRVMANHLPSNIRSERLLKKLGFEREGYARSYLKIAGHWQDMVLNSRVNPVG